MGDLPAFPRQLIFYFYKLLVQFPDLLREPPYCFLSGCCAFFQAYACFCVLYNLLSPAVAASSQLCFMPDIPQPFCSQPEDILRERRFFQDRNTECTVYLPECVLIFYTFSGRYGIP